MLLNVEEGQAPRVRGKRETIPHEKRRAVFERDGGKCAQRARVEGKPALGWAGTTGRGDVAIVRWRAGCG